MTDSSIVMSMVLAAQEIRFSENRAGEIADEVNQLFFEIRKVSGCLTFDDEPSQFSSLLETSSK